MKSNIYSIYTPPQFEVIEVEMESAVLQSSGRTSSTDSLENETFNW